MPYVVVEAFPGRTIDQKRRLAEAITSAVCETFGARREGVRVVFREVEEHDYAQGGRLWSDLIAEKTGNA